MEREGFANVFQLEGGILKYFEECGGAHYNGECFVFDQRVGVDPALRETASAQCFVCQTPLTPAEQSDPRYVIGQSCPYCFRSSTERMLEDIARREKIFKRMADPLPGSIPYENRRPFLIPPGMDGLTLVDAACTIFPHHSREDWLEPCAMGRVLDSDGKPVAADSLVRSGGRYEVVQPDIVEPPVNACIRLIHEDEAIIVVNKPAPLPVHPSGRFNKNTLQFFLAAAFAPQHPRPAHRLDAATTGVMVWTRTRHFAKLIQPQFERGSVEKRYLACIHGHPAADTFRCEAPISPEPGPVGSRSIARDVGLRAMTEFRLIERRPDGTSLVEAIPRTGRTNQIRVHLWQLGTPVVGDCAYLPDQERGRTLTQTPDQPPLCLHASSLTFNHPLTRQSVTFSAPPPAWAT
jgi:RluA family pseudouridine synthase